MTSSNSSNEIDLGNTSIARSISPSIHWIFTLNNYTKDDILEICSNDKISKYIFQEETGQNGTPHLQGYIAFKKKNRPIGLFSSNRYHFEKCKFINSAIEYCQKEDTRTGNIYSKGIPIKEKIRIIEKLYTWQQEIVDKCNTIPNDRTINIIVDIEGNKGKTQICRYLCYHHNALCVSGKSNDIKYAIVAYHKEKGYYPRVILLDVPRSNLAYISYESVEKVKDGLFFCGKYESCQVLMNPPHIFIFMNEYPDTSKMTTDKWDIKEL